MERRYEFMEVVPVGMNKERNMKNASGKSAEDRVVENWKTDENPDMNKERSVSDAAKEDQMEAGSSSAPGAVKDDSPKELSGLQEPETEEYSLGEPEEPAQPKKSEEAKKSEETEEPGEPVQLKKSEEPETSEETEEPEEPAQETEEPEEPVQGEKSEKPEKPEKPDHAGKAKTQKASMQPAVQEKTVDREWHNAQQQDTIESRKARSGRTAFWISLILILGILGGIYAYGYKYCGTHFMPGTRINGYECSGLTEEEAEAKFAEAANDYVLNIRFRGGSTEIVHAQEMGFEYKPDGSVGALLNQQDQLLWPKYFFEDSNYEIEPGGAYDDDLLTQALQALPELQEENMEKPKSAYIEFEDGNEEEAGKFVIIPETAGTTIDLVQLEAGVGDAAARYADLVDAEEISGAYVEAPLKSDDAKIISRCDDLNDIVGASITYELPDGDTMCLNSDVMKDWLVKDDDGKLVKDDEVWDEKLWEFLEKLAINSNTIGMDRQFQSTNRGLITVSGGDYGYMVNQVTEHDKLVKDLKKCKQDTRKPDYYITPYNDETENDGIGKTYIEVDLSAQHIWCYVDGQMVMESDCVSGDTTTGHGTPTGVFGIMFMLRDTTLRGVMQSNGKYEYETKVGYWMPFYDGCGFHDAWWRTAFGGTIYQGDGSHGCVNLPVSGAETLYQYCEDKMPVVVYY